MGATKKTNKPAIFLQIREGYLCEYVGTERKDKSNIESKNRFYEPYEEISGYLTYIGINPAGTEAKKWEELQIRLSEEGQPDVLLKVSFPSREASEILNRLTTHFEEIEKEPEPDYFIKIRSWKNDEGRTVVILRDRENKTISRQFTKDEPNGLPEMKQKKKRNGEIEFDHEDQDIFFTELCATMQSQVKEHNMNSKTVGEAMEEPQE